MTTHLEFTAEIIEALNYERFHYPIPFVQRRMEALWLKSYGLPDAQIAELSHISETMLHECFQLYFEGGVEGLKQAQFDFLQSPSVRHVTP